MLQDYIPNRYVNIIYLTVLIYLDEQGFCRLLLQQYIPNIPHVEQVTMRQTTMRMITTNKVKFSKGNTSIILSTRTILGDVDGGELVGIIKTKVKKSVTNKQK